uniref:Fatty acid hydroxylase family protein n=1 Tax=Pithovirus LCPAC304 TaxID=2506594 RepID=A0A481Z9E2_9VIRU|nr:MAG: fatty acid hydroxylase family protein [Pithovirus LCPAC304]
MISRKSLVKFLGIHLVFGSLSTLQFWILSLVMGTWTGIPFIGVMFLITLLKNYAVLIIDALYVYPKKWANAEEREHPTSRYVGEFHLFFWMAALVESTSVCLLSVLFGFATDPSTYCSYVVSYLYFFPLMFAFEVFFDFFHYWAHRQSHVGFFYKYFHKIHHRHRYTTGILTYYQHPLDLVLSNTIPTLLSFAILMWMFGMRMDLFQFSLLSVFKSATEIGGHLGKEMEKSSSCPQFFWLPKWLGIELYPSDHGLHHTHFNYNFSKRLSLWDKTFGTYRRPCLHK